MIKKTFALLPLLVCLAVPAFGQTFVFDLRGSQEVPPVPSTATGGCYGELNQGAATFAMTCVHDVVNATVMHIHRAPAGANGPIAFDMGDPSSGFVNATWTGMTPTNIADLLAGNLYVNIHTAGRPAGEIRGQILTRTVDMVEFTVDGSQVVPAGTSPSNANCTANLNDAATALDIACTHNVAAPNAAHVHEAPFGENGPVVFTFPSPASPLSGSMPLTPRLVADFAATFLYLDIHAGTSEADANEIRGQIGLPPAGAGTGTIVIEKTTYPAGGANFGFTETITPGAFTLNDTQTRTFSGVLPGTYTITETDPSSSGFTLADISCDDSDSSGNISTRAAAITLTAGETVRCTFSNFETAPTDDLFILHLSGDQEVPPVLTTKRGGCMGRFSAASSEFSLVCTHNVDDATVMHIHRAPAGANGPIAFDMGEPVSPVIATWSGMTPADVADLFAGNLYLNIHTAGRPSGEVRGQILPRTVDTVVFTADAGQVVPPGTSGATANCTADLSATADQLAFNCTHNLPSPDSAHVHQGERGTNGPVVFNFPSPASPIAASMPVTPRLVADYVAELLYLDIHSVAGEESAAGQQIRGQIAPPVAAITTGTIRISKATSPDGGTGFGFTDNVPGSAGTFILNDGGTQTFANVPIGTYTITENASASHTLTDIVCGDNDSVGNAFARTATINLQAGETVDCRFTNLRNVSASPTLFVFHLSGDQEVPPVASTARGGCFGRLDQAASTFSLVCTHNVSSATITHIHRAPAGANGPVAFDLGDPVSPIEATWTGMTPADIADLLAGNLYVNIHAGGRPEGEIRGQILPRTVDSFSFEASGDQEVPPTDSTATGNCDANLSDLATSVFVQCTHNVDELTDIHLHAAPPGVDGPAIFNFPETNPFSGDVPLTPRLVADFAAGFLYVNIHSTDYDTGEIRGQLLGAESPAVDLAVIPTASEWGLIAMALGLLLVAARRLI